MTAVDREQLKRDCATTEYRGHSPDGLVHLNSVERG